MHGEQNQLTSFTVNLCLIILCLKLAIRVQMRHLYPKYKKWNRMGENGVEKGKKKRKPA